LQRLVLLQLLRRFEPLELGGAGFGGGIVLSELYEVICTQAGLKDDDGLVAAAALHPFCNTIHADRKRGEKGTGYFIEWYDEKGKEDEKVACPLFLVAKNLVLVSYSFFSSS